MKIKKNSLKVESFYQQKKIVENYDNYRFSSYGGKIVNNLELEKITSFLKKKGKNLKCLDIGCGTGRLTKLLSDKGFTVVGLDSSKIMIQKLRQMENKNLTTKIGSAFDLPFAKNSFDIVTALRFFDHFNQQDIEKILVNIKKVLKPNGQIIFNSLNKYSFEAFLPELTFGKKKINFYYGNERLKEVFEKNGFILKDYKNFFIFPRGLYMHLPYPFPKILLKLDELLNLTPFSYFCACQFWCLEKKPN